MSEENKISKKFLRKIRENCKRRYRYVVPPKFRVNYLKVLGCSWEEYYNYLQNQFIDENGIPKTVSFKEQTHNMDWYNYGWSWHIDHIQPLHIFDPENIEDQKKMFNYKNTQPICADKHVDKTIKDLGKDDLNDYGQIWMLFRDN